MDSSYYNNAVIKNPVVVKIDPLAKSGESLVSSRD